MASDLDLFLILTLAYFFNHLQLLKISLRFGIEPRDVLDHPDDKTTSLHRTQLCKI